MRSWIITCTCDHTTKKWKNQGYILKNTSDYDDAVLYEIEEKLAETSAYAMDAVIAAFEGADVDLQAKKIIWSDSEILTIEQSAHKISLETGADNGTVITHIKCWLTMDFVPEGLNQEQMNSFEDQINEWVKDY